jgi:DNA-binding transcriptional LysR family regulator
MSLGNLDLQKLKAFQLVAKHGGLRVAAARLRLSVPAVSFQIKRLEQEIGVALFQRMPNGLVLTPIGETFLREVDDFLGRFESALAMLTSKATPTGHLSMSTSSDIVWYFTRPISAFIKRYPGVQLRHHVYNSIETLRLVGDGALDVGIGYFPKLPKGVVRESIVESTLSLACAPAHAILRRQPIRLEDIARHKLILLPHLSATRKIIDQAFASANITSSDVIEAGNCQTARDFAANGVGVAIVHSLCLGHMPTRRLRYLDVGVHFGKVDFSVIYRADSPRASTLRAFLEHLTMKKEL